MVERELVRESYSGEFTLKNTTDCFFSLKKSLTGYLQEIITPHFLLSENKVHSSLMNQQSSFMGFSFLFLSFEFCLLSLFLLRLTFKL